MAPQNILSRFCCASMCNCVSCGINSNQVVPVYTTMTCLQAAQPGVGMQTLFPDLSVFTPTGTQVLNRMLE